MDVVKPRPIGENYCGPAVTNSAGVPAQIRAFGVPYWWHNDVRLDAFDMAQNQFGFFLVSATPSFVAGPGGSQGNLCLGGNIGRYVSNVMNTGAGGAFSLQIDLAALPTNPPSGVATGDVWHFQTWFRDSNPGQTSNFTDAISISF